MAKEDIRRFIRLSEAPRGHRESERLFRPTSRKLESARRIVVKIGSALIVDQATGRVREPWLEMLADDVARLRGRGQDVAVVSSGAVAVGRYALDLHQKTLRKTEWQAAAAVGQIQLAKAYREAFARHRLTAAQILLTLDDTTEKKRMAGVRATLIRLLTLQAVPVVNENDAVARNIASFGDNDRLAARAARLIEGDTLVLLSNVAGLYSADPHESSSATLITDVNNVTAEIEQMAGSARSGYSSGGMVTKLVAGKMALASGCTMIIADGRDPYPLSAIDDGSQCTWFRPSTAARVARKTRIATTLRPLGALVVDNAAVNQLRSGEGLCIPEVRSFDGDFGRGDAIVIRDICGHEVARGLSIYSSAEIRRITRRSGLGTGWPLTAGSLDLIVHSDDLVLTD
ncbi:glutamate 5-kinase [Bradyrhizobium vignae]|uniref:Glutamate 5-kinase n=1 Tax=Bradyrhizobium vignae TaxID=1549949 RepID=A0A2U3Q9Z4_9BRAD|nr:glutamate 5-kinase [Bradyrhizobium vignae]SPP98234.1 Glutamate 5-kinase 1 [Bradyrhizobium vignae]